MEDDFKKGRPGKTAFAGEGLASYGFFGFW
jgi:hypothetical protein